MDPAIFRRLEKRIFVDLPDVQARKDMFEYYLSEMLQKNKYIKCEIDSNSLAQVTITYKSIMCNFNYVNKYLSLPFCRKQMVILVQI